MGIQNITDAEGKLIARRIIWRLRNAEPMSKEDIRRRRLEGLTLRDYHLMQDRMKRDLAENPFNGVGHANEGYLYESITGHRSKPLDA